MIQRRKTRQIRVKDVAIGGGAEVSIQSMTKTNTSDIDATVRQIMALATAGCQIVRVAVPNKDAAAALARIRREADKVALVADIHFHAQFAIAAIEAGFDKIRWNPGNIRDTRQIAAVVERAKDRGIPMRVGVNVGSLDSECEDSNPRDLAEAMVQSALKSVRLMEELDFHDIVVSLKSSDVLQSIAAYRRMAELCDYPLHLGITEAGLWEDAIVKSSVGIGALLSEGIGDTVRVSITGDPVDEVFAAQKILSSLRIRNFDANVIACPSCGRCEIDLPEIAKQVRHRLRELSADNQRLRDISVAVMGCVVNGPGESERADVGLAGGSGFGIIYRKGRQVRRVAESGMVDALIEEACRIAKADSPRQAAEVWPV